MSEAEAIEIEAVEELVEEAVVEEQADLEPEAGEDEGPVVIRIEGEEPEAEQARDPDLVRHLRSVIAEQNKLIKKQAKAEPVIDELPPRPTRDQFDYIDADYDKALDDWHDKRRDHEAKQQQAKAEAEANERKWQATVEAYDARKASLKVDDYDLAESAVSDVFDHMRVGLIVEGCEKPEQVMYALGKNPAVLKRFAAMDSIAKFAVAIGKFEEKLVIEKKAPPPPEGKLRGTAPASGAVDGTLERLRAEAARTNDFSKVAAYKRQLQKVA